MTSTPENRSAATTENRAAVTTENRAAVTPEYRAAATPENRPPATILLGDDHALVRRGLRLILDNEPDLTVVAEAGDGAEAVEQVKVHQPDIAILDIAMPRLILTMYDNEQYVIEALQAGAVGYVLKSVVDRDLVEACRAAMRNEPFLYPGAVNTLIRNLLDRTRGNRSAKVITEREEEILKLVAEGYSSKQIAEMLVISVKTVERHRANLLQKLGLRDRLDLTRYAIRAGLIEP